MSSTQINVFYELQVAAGKADELREIAAQMVAFNRQGEPGTLVYNIYLSEDQKLLTYWETHADSEAYAAFTRSASQRENSSVRSSAELRAPASVYTARSHRNCVSGRRTMDSKSSTRITCRIRSISLKRKKLP